MDLSIAFDIFKEQLIWDYFIGLFYSKDNRSELIAYADTGFLSGHYPT